MKLAKWMDQKKITGAELARRLGKSESSIYKWMREERHPKIEMARRIERLTGGEVTIAELVKDGACLKETS